MTHDPANGLSSLDALVGMDRLAILNPDSVIARLAYSQLELGFATTY